MHRQKIIVGGNLTGVVQTANDRPHFAPPPPSEVLPFARPAEPEPTAPPPPVVASNPAEIAAVRSMLAELGPILAKLRSREQATTEQIAQAAVELGVALAERLLATHIAQNRQRLDRIVRDAIDRMPRTDTVTIRGHADDLALLEKLLAEGDAEPAISFRAEPGCERGKVKIDANDWFVDFDTQRSLSDLRDRLLEEVFMAACEPEALARDAVSLAGASGSQVPGEVG